jgi:hypothetical protein
VHIQLQRFGFEARHVNCKAAAGRSHRTYHGDSLDASNLQLSRVQRATNQSFKSFRICNLTTAVLSALATKKYNNSPKYHAFVTNDGNSRAKVQQQPPKPQRQQL